MDWPCADRPTNSTVVNDGACMSGFRFPLPMLSLCLSLLVLAAGCRDYPAISREAYELARGIDNVCNLKDASQLPRVRRILQERQQAGDITEREHDWLTKFVDLAERGEWDAASTQARRMLASQTVRK